jgi:hypothetical protein
VADLVVQALCDPASLTGLSESRWELLVRQARQADLLGRIGSSLERRGLISAVPASPRRHLDGALALSDAQRREVLREVRYLTEALSGVPVELVLLKGAAYATANLPPCGGRLFSDIDILVPRAKLAAVESNLMMRGWVSTHLDAYDQRYYREWMHELPPLEHSRRGTVVDVHHAILPLTARPKPETAKLLAKARQVDGMPGVSVLAPVDMVLHSIAHLTYNDDLSHGLRDLSDLDLLLRHFGGAPEFWSELIARSRELDLMRPLHYGLRCSHHILNTPIPESTLIEAACGAPARPLGALMQALWLRALASQHPTSAPPLTGVALFLLYLRAHWLRMPPALLARHLTVKAWKRAHRVDGEARPL